MLRQVTHRDGSVRNVHLGGWRKQFRDERDDAYSLKLRGGLLTGALPANIDQRGICSPVEDQGDLGSCTAHMFAALVEANERRSKVHLVRAGTPTTVTVGPPSVAADGTITFMTTVKPSVAPAPSPNPTPPPNPQLIRASRLLQYYATRKLEGTVSEDSGATIRDAIKAGVVYGVADESLWPYDVSKFTVNPPPVAWSAASAHKVTSYHAIADGDLETMKSAIVGGYLVGFGFSVYDYMLSQQMAATGYLPLPGSGEKLQGGHAVALVGYDDNLANPRKPTEKGAFLVRNSWGTGWGQQGYFWMAYDYVGNTRLANDFWVVQSAPI